MAIKDKDGKIFKLTGPNQVISMQNAWDHSKIVFHNMHFPVIISKDTKRFYVNDDEIFGSSPVPVEEEIPSVEQHLDIVQTQNLTGILERRKIKLLCLPAKQQKYEDPLYGSSYVRTEFGQKTTITGVIISTEDLFFVFWTEQSLEKKSIVYPTQTETKRWWQVDKCEIQAGGFLVSCSPSPTSPDFSD